MCSEMQSGAGCVAFFHSMFVTVFYLQWQQYQCMSSVVLTVCAVAADLCPSISDKLPLKLVRLSVPNCNQLAETCR